MTVTISSAVGGLFGFLENGGVIRELGIINPNVTATANGAYVGAIAGVIRSGSRVHSSYVREGSVTVAVNSRAGELVGVNQGTIEAGYATAAVSVAGSGVSNNIRGSATSAATSPPVTPSRR